MKVSEIQDDIRDILEKWKPFAASDATLRLVLSDLEALLPASGAHRLELRKQAQRVLDHINARTGRKQQRLGLIPARLNDRKMPASVEECILVIDWLLDASGKPEEWLTNCINSTTPFRPDLFDKFKAAAEQWQEARRGRRGYPGNVVI